MMSDIKEMPCPLFLVYDKKTGRTANPTTIAVEEEWANKLIYCDMEGFSFLEDGQLILCDESGQFAYAPPGRFEVYLSLPRLIGMT